MSYILYIVILTLIIAPLYLIWAIYRINKKLRRIDWLRSQEYAVMRIDVPRNNEKSPLSAEQMFASLHGIFSESAEFQNHVSFEIVAKDKYIQFYVYVPTHLRDFVEGQIYAQYPTVEINDVDDYIAGTDISGKSYASTELRLNKPDVYPIKQFTDFEVDPISGITAVMAKLNPGEEVWFQMVVRPVGDEWQENGHNRVTAIRTTGRSAGSSVIGRSVSRSIFNFLKAFMTQVVRPGADSVTPDKEIKLPAAVEEALKCIEQKITKLGFETKIRILSIGHDSVAVRLRNQNIAAAFKQYNTTNLNGFRASETRINKIEDLKDFSERSFEGTGQILNIAELASVYHLPHQSVSTPSIVWSGSKKGEPPANLPLAENTPAEELTVIGETNFRNVYRTFGIKADDRRRHIYIIGKSGVGKSVLIENMAIDDVIKGKGVIIVDPHGELAEKVLSCIPDHRVDDVVVFDPSDREYPIAFNLLENVDEDFKSIVASGFVGIFKKLFDKSWGPRLEHILRNTIFALLDYPDSTMLDIPRVLTNARFRDKVVENIKDPIIREFWQNEFASFDNKFRTEAVSPILNKVGQFLSSSTIRNIVGQPKSTLNIREIMDQKKIMIVNLSRGKIGEDNSALLGAMMITKIQLAAMSRADVTIDKRPDTYLYVDEFQNFATDSFAIILAEARKYNLNLTMAHQYIMQMPDTVREAVFGNAGTLITFRVGGGDADFLVKEYAPVFEGNDLVNLDKYHIYVKLLIDGISSPAFSARTLPPVSQLSGNIEKVAHHSRQKYSNARNYVEDLISNRSRQEEMELLAEAEAFKKGGLEAILLKKEMATPNPESSGPAARAHESSPKISPSPIVRDAPPPSIRPAIAPGPAVSTLATVVPPKATPAEEGPSAGMAGEGQASTSEAPRAVKLESILDGKIYKERTARGGVKWYLGEEIDEEKMAEKRIIIDDEARHMIEQTKEMAKQKSSGHHGHRDHTNHEKQNKDKVGESTQKKNSDEIVPGQEHPSLPADAKPAPEDKPEPKQEPMLPVAQKEGSKIPEAPVSIEPAFEAAPTAVIEAPDLNPALLSQNQPVKIQEESKADNPPANLDQSTGSDNAVHLEEGKAIKIE